jgi:hypothetical protein
VDDSGGIQNLERRAVGGSRIRRRTRTRVGIHKEGQRSSDFGERVDHDGVYGSPDLDGP